MISAHWIASGGGIGRFPIAPGTAASFVAVPIGAVALLIDYRLLTLLALGTCVIGTWAIHETGELDDPGWIVVDEFAGQWIAMLGIGRLGLYWPYWLIAAFVLFRILDIVKIGPVRWADRKDGAIGVMADDVVAGIIAATLLFIAALIVPLVLPFVLSTQPSDSAN